MIEHLFRVILDALKKQAAHQGSSLWNGGVLLTHLHALGPWVLLGVALKWLQGESHVLANIQVQPCCAPVVQSLLAMVDIIEHFGFLHAKAAKNLAVGKMVIPRRPDPITVAHR